MECIIVPFLFVFPEGLQLGNNLIISEIQKATFSIEGQRHHSDPISSTKKHTKADLQRLNQNKDL